MSESSVSVVMCDHSCRPDCSADLISVSTRLLDHPRIDSVSAIPGPCRSGAPVDFGDQSSACVCFAGCADATVAAGAEQPVFVIDTRTDVYDLYRGDDAIESRMYQRIVSELALLPQGSVDVPIPDDAGKRSDTKTSESHLVIGGGISGLHIALELAGHGLKVDRIDTGGPPFSPGSLATSLEHPELEAALSTAVDTHESICNVPVSEVLRIVPTSEGVELRQKRGGVTRYDHVVAAPELEESATGKGILGLTDLYEGLRNGRIRSREACFILDSLEDTTPAIFEDVMHAALRLVRTYRSQVTVFMQQARVSGPGGEELYGRCREAGVIFVKYGDDLEVGNEYGDITVSATDERSGRACVVEQPDLCVIPGHMTPHAAALELLHGRDRMEQSYLRPGSIWLSEDETALPWLSVAGPAARPVASAGTIRMDWLRPDESVELRRSNSRAKIDTGACVRCLTCVRSCPFGAVVKVRGAGSRSPIVIEAMCRGCGVCSAACPAGAIELEARPRNAVVESGAVLGEMLVVHCAEGGRLALNSMIEQGNRISSTIGMLEVPCTGSIEESLVLELLERGITDMLVVGCREQNCRFLEGNLRGERKVDRIKSILKAAGVEDISVRMMFVAPDEGRRLYAAVEAMQTHDQPPASTGGARGSHRAEQD